MSGEHTHPLIEYWEKAFSRYAVRDELGLQFRIPQFMDPIMSPHFVCSDLTNFLAQPELTHLNYIGGNAGDWDQIQSAGFQPILKFQVGVRELTGKCSELSVSSEVVPLSEAIDRDDFWELIAQGFPSDPPFLRELLPFLGASSTHHETIFLYDKQGPVATITLGMQRNECLGLVAAVSAAKRGEGWSHHLVKAASELARARGVERAIFWTEHAFLMGNADKTLDYRIFAKV